MDIKRLTIADLHAAYASGSLSVEAVTGAYLDAITHRDGKVKAFLSVLASTAIERAEALDKRLAAGEKPSGLFGVPMAIKDNLCLAGTRTTAGSQALENYIAPYTATAVQRLLDAGAVILGKTNLDEFAMGSSTENSAFQKTTNPWDATRVPGGSSGGSAAAVSAEEVLVALGSDTGGSIRQPASFCGLVGLKPTYGRVSRAGLIALASSLDQVGPFARTVADALTVFQTIAGPDAADATTIDAPHVDAAVLQKGFKGLRVGVLPDAQMAGVDPGVAERVADAVRIMEHAGATIVPVQVTHIEDCLAMYAVMVTSEASSNLARYDGLRFGTALVPEPKEDFAAYTQRVRGATFGAEPQRRILLGTYALSKGYAGQFYHRAQTLQAVIAQEFDKVFASVDVLFGPTSPSVAFPLGAKFNDPLTMYLSDIFTVPANIANLPAMSMPIGFSQHLPVGGQFIAARYREDSLFQVAAAFEGESGIRNLAAPAQ
ncbi:MAG: Asp-tRNA(Asn)/Glu-tRNA(Gln) amidotransferase subunit GatA [Patescibacteria group bacterium]